MKRQFRINESWQAGKELGKDGWWKDFPEGKPPVAVSAGGGGEGAFVVYAPASYNSHVYLSLVYIRSLKGT